MQGVILTTIYIYIYGVRKEEGENILDFVTSYLVIINTCFKKR